MKLRLKGSTFNPKHTFENGQCFRWSVEHDGAYIGVIGDAVVRVSEDGEDYLAEVVLGALSEAGLAYYFDDMTDYAAIEERLKGWDPWLKKATETIGGLRLLKQDPFEMLLSFIISSNNNIPKIRQSIDDLCRRYGSSLGIYKGIPYFAFPTLDQLKGLSEADFKVKAIGYRAKSLYLTVNRLVDEAVDLTMPYALSLEEGIEFLTQFYGVGEKVAQCILLFGYGQIDAYPIDTWVKQMLTTLYGVEPKPKAYKAFIVSHFSEYRGYAQQILFYYMRSYYQKDNGAKQ